MKRLLRDTAGKSGLEYLLIVAAIGTMGAVPFWAFGTGMHQVITDTTYASTLPALGSQSMAHSAAHVEGMCYVQTFADNGSDGKDNAERLGANLSAQGFEDVYVTQNQNGFYVTRIRTSCEDASTVLSLYNEQGITSDAYIGDLPKSDDALFGGGSTPTPDPTPANDNNGGDSEQLELPLENATQEPTPEPDVSGGGAGPNTADANVGSNAQAGAGLPARDVSNNPMQQALNEILELSDDELKALIAQEGTTPGMEAIVNSFYSAIPEECFTEQGLTEQCANNQEVQAVLQMADNVYYTLLSEAANELTYREFASMSEAELTQSIADAQMILEECTALSPAPAFTEDGYPAVNESCQNENGEKFYTDFANAMEGVQTEEAYMQAMESFAQTDIAGQCWATQNQPTYDESGMMAATEACAGNEAKMNAFMDAQLNGEALMYTLERQTFEGMFGADAYEGAHSLQLLEYDENGQLVRSERLYKQAESMGLLEPGAFEAAVAQDQAQLDELQGGEQPQVDAGGEEIKEEGGGGLFGWIGKAANWVGDKVKWNEAIDWIADIGGDIPVIDQLTNGLAGIARLSNVINPLAWMLEPADTANFAKNLAIGVGKEFWDMGKGVVVGLIGDVGYNWFVKEGIMGGFGLLDGGQFWKSAGNFVVKTPGALWNMGKDIVMTAATGLDGSKPIDEQAQALGRTGAFVGTVWIGGSAAAAKLGKVARGQRVVAANVEVTNILKGLPTTEGYLARATALENRLLEAGKYTQAAKAGHLKSAFQTRIDKLGDAVRVTEKAAKAPTALGRTKWGMSVGDRMARPIQAVYNNRVFNAPSRAWNSLAKGLEGTSNRVLRATGTPQAFGMARKGAAQWAASPQMGWMWRHPYFFAAGAPVYKSGARTDDADHDLKGARDMMKAMSEGMMPGGGGGGLAGAASGAAAAGH